MITLKQESVLIKKLKSLTELELISVLDELAEHIYKNNLSDAVEQALDVHDLKGDIRSLERDIEELQEDISELKNKMREADDVLQDIENLDDDVQKEIDKAIDLLNV